MDHKAEAMQIWKREHFVGRWDVDPRKVKEPNSAIKIRDVNAKHVEELVESFRKTGDKNERVSLVAVGYNGPRDLDKLLAHGLQAIEGLHTTAALRILCEKYPKNPRWKQMQASVYVCDDSEANRAMLRILGGLSNLKNKKALNTSFTELVKMMHDQMISEMKQQGISEDEDLPVAFTSQMKRDWAYANEISINTIGGYWNIAKFKGKVWQAIWEVLDPANPVPGVGYNQLIKILGLGESNVLALLQELKKGTLVPKAFGKRCDWVKALYRLQEAAVQYVMLTGKLEVDGWEDLKEKVPGVTDEWLESYVEAFQKEKNTVPKELHRSLEYHITNAGKLEVTCL